MGLKLPSNVLAAVASDAATRQATVTGAGTPVPIIYGRQRIGAQIVAVAVNDSKLILACAWCLGEIQAVESITINGEAPAGSVTITHYLGTAVQGVDATLAAAISGYSDTLRATVGGQAVAVAYSVVQIPATISGGFPRIEAIIQGRKLYDPRTTTTVYSTNPALALRDFITNAAYGQGQTVTDAEIITLANACDDLLSDSSKRREINIIIDNPAPCAQWVDVLRSYAGAFATPEGATVRVVPDRPATPLAGITASNIAAGSFALKKRSRRAAPTVVRVKYTNTAATPWRDAEAVAMVSGVESGTVPRREEVVDMPGITRYAQAYREAVERLNAANLTDLDAEWTCFDEALAYQVGDVLPVTHPIGLVAKNFRITQLEQPAPGRWRITASEYSADVYSDAVAGEPGADSPLPSPSAIAAPVIGTIASGSAYLLRQSDGTIISQMLVPWTASSDPYHQWTDVRYKRPDDSSYTLAAPVPAGTNSAIAGPLEDGTTYEVGVRFRNNFGVVSSWTTATHTVVGQTEPPPAPQQFLITRDADGTRRFTWAPPTTVPVDLDGYRLRYKIGAGQVWADMYDLHQGVVTSSPYETNQLAAGTYTFAVASVDTTGNISDPVYIEATIGDPRLAGALDIFAPHLESWPGTLTNCTLDVLTGWLMATDSKTWADLGTDGKTWDTWDSWTRASATLTYTDGIKDVGVITKFTPLLSADYDGSATLEVRTSNDNVTWSAWGVATGQVTTRYIQARATVVPPSPTDSVALLKTMTLILEAAPVVEDFNDIATSSLTGSYRIGTGDIRLPLTASFGVIRGITVALQNVGAGWSWEVIDKDTAVGPRIKIYNASNTLADATIDATVRGV